MSSHDVAVKAVKQAVADMRCKWAVYVRTIQPGAPVSVFELYLEHDDYDAAKANADEFPEAFVAFVAYRVR